MMSIKKNYLLVLSYQLVYILTPLVATPYISRVLGATEIGEYAFYYSVAFYFTLFIRLGVLTYGNRTIAANRNDRKKVSEAFWEIYLVQLICGVVFSFLYILWTVLFAPRAIISAALLLFVLSATIDITWLLYGVEDFTVTTIRDILIRLLSLVLVLLLVKNSSDLWIYTIIMSASYFVGQLFAWMRIKKYVLILCPNKFGVISHIKPNLVLFIPTIAVSIYKTMDKIMLGTMTVSKELGFYECADKVICVPMAFITALATVMLPKMSNMVANDTSERMINKVIDKSLVFTAFVSSSICFGLMSVANQFVPLFYGEGYIKCVDVYAWLLPSCVFLAYANVLRTQYLLPHKRDRQYICSLFIGAGVNLVLNLLLIPRYASIGAAIATFAAEGTVCVVQIKYTWKELELWKSLIKVLPFIIAGIGMFVFFRNKEIQVGNDIKSLIIKIVECGMCYLAILGVILFIYTIVKTVASVIRNA